MTRRARSLAVSLGLHVLALWALWRLLAPGPPASPVAMELALSPPAVAPAPAGTGDPGIRSQGLEKPAEFSPVRPLLSPVRPQVSLEQHTGEKAAAVAPRISAVASATPAVPSGSAVPVVAPLSIPLAAAPKAAAKVTMDDTPVKILRQTAPRYPWRARAARREGAVEVCFEVDAGGAVRNPRAAGDTAEVAWFGAAACDAVAAWTFTPARRAGRPIASQARVRVRFSLDR